MRILIIHNILNDSRSVNGVLRHYAWMAEEWNRTGHPTDFLVAKAGFPQLRELAPSARLISSDNFFNATNHINQTWRYFPAYAWRMLNIHWTRLPEKYDLIYASAPFIFEMYPALVLRRRLNAALATKIHHTVSAQEKRRGIVDRLFCMSERISAVWIKRHADAVICSTPLVAADFEHLERRCGLTPVDKEYIGYGIDYDVLAASRSKNKIYDAIILSRIHQQKGAFDISAFWKAVIEKRPDARLLVIGEGSHRPRAEQLVREVGLANSVTFTGGIPEAEKNRLLGQCKIGISLSYEEGWGVAINEFLAVGIPVVAYHLPVFDLVFPQQLQQVPCGDTRAVAAEVLRLLGDDALRDELGARGTEFVQKYDFRGLARTELAALQKGLIHKDSGTLISSKEK
jgi:glycosyltransferase involved in cell wall biosynthesis